MKATVNVRKNNDSGGRQVSEEITLNGVASGDDDENKKWAKATPVLTLNATVDNPEAFGALDGIKEVYIDISAATTDKQAADKHN